MTWSELLFAATFPLVVPFWALMILLPRWRWTERIIGSPWIVAVPLVPYLLALVPQIGTFVAAIASPSFEGVRAVLGSPLGTAAIWAHLIAFDTFVARFMYRDSRRRDVPALIMAVLLIVTIVLAPVGLLLYLAVRGPAGRVPVDRSVPAF